MAQKCVHKGCGKKFDDSDEPCTYHPGPPEFHEGQKGWHCCKPRVLTFDEFLAIPPCTTGKHSTIDDTPAPPSQPDAEQASPPKPVPVTKPVSSELRKPQPAQPPAEAPPPPPPESDSDDPSLPISANTTCRRRGCQKSSMEATAKSREGEECVYHPGHPIFHEGSKGWTCCKRRVLDFDEFMRIGGCTTKGRHLFVGSGKKRGGEGGEEKVEAVRHDFYQTPTTVHASLYLKKISKDLSKISFPDAQTLELDLHTSDKKYYAQTVPLYGPVDTEQSKWRIAGTKIEFTLVKADGLSWPVLRADEPVTGEIIQVGKAGRA